jgi:hypothetical protein
MDSPLARSAAGWRQRVPGTLLIAAFGLTLSALAWLDVAHRTASERAAEIARVRHENGGLARAFEEHVRQSIRTADSALLFLQHEYEIHGEITQSMREFAVRTKSDPVLNQIALADERGNLLLSAVPLAKPVNIAQREHFRVHAEGNAAGLFIGKPVLTKVSGTWSFFLSRRLRRPDGSFGGIVSAGIDPAYFANYYADPELDRKSVVWERVS